MRKALLLVLWLVVPGFILPAMGCGKGALPGACENPHSSHNNGMGEEKGDYTGVKAYITIFDPKLCTTTDANFGIPSQSAAWVSLRHQEEGKNWVQVGYVKKSTVGTLKYYWEFKFENMPACDKTNYLASDLSGKDPQPGETVQFRVEKKGDEWEVQWHDNTRTSDKECAKSCKGVRVNWAQEIHFKTTRGVGAPTKPVFFSTCERKIGEESTDWKNPAEWKKYVINPHPNLQNNWDGKSIDMFSVYDDRN